MPSLAEGMSTYSDESPEPIQKVLLIHWVTSHKPTWIFNFKFLSIKGSMPKCRVTPCNRAVNFPILEVRHFGFTSVIPITVIFPRVVVLMVLFLMVLFLQSTHFTWLLRMWNKARWHGIFALKYLNYTTTNILCARLALVPRVIDTLCDSQDPCLYYPSTYSLPQLPLSTLLFMEKKAFSAVRPSGLRIHTG